MFSKFLHPQALVFVTLALFATTDATILPRPSPTPYQCSVLHVTESVSTLQLQFKSTTNAYVVDLARTHASRNKHTIQIDNAHHQFDVSHHKWMSGHVVDHAQSSARIHVDTSTPSVCDDVSGTFKVANKTYVLEQVDGELRIHKETDLVAAAKQGLRFDSLDESPNDKSPTQNKSPYQNKSIASDDEKFRNRREQRSRRAALSTEGISCGVFLDADLSFFEAHKGSCDSSLDATACAALQRERVAVKMIDGLQMVAEIYQSDSILKSEIDFHVEGTHILDANLFVDGEDAETAIRKYEDYLDDLSTRNSDDVCLNHLFSHAKFDGQDVGVSNVGFGLTRGVCGTRGRNSGITTTGFVGLITGQWLMTQVAAHHIGHNLGAAHDDGACLDTCSLMSPFLCVDENAQTEISTCTVSSIQNRLAELVTDPNDFFAMAPLRCLKDVPPPRVCRVDEYTKRTSHRDTDPSRILSNVKGSLTVGECAKKCAKDTRCSSFNYRRGIAKCVLTSAPDRTKSYATPAGQKWDNYQMSDTCYDDCPATELDRFVNAGGARDKSGKSGNLIKTIKNVSKKKCAIKCENNADCYAFNHRTAVDRVLFPYKCELLRAPDPYDFSYQSPASITVGWRYFRMKSSCASVKGASKPPSSSPN